MTILTTNYKYKKYNNIFQLKFYNYKIVLIINIFLLEITYGVLANQWPISFPEK